MAKSKLVSNRSASQTRVTYVHFGRQNQTKASHVLLGQRLILKFTAKADTNKQFSREQEQEAKKNKIKIEIKKIKKKKKKKN